MAQEFKFGWLKDLIPPEQKFGRQYGFLPITRYHAEIDTKKRHSLFELFSNMPSAYYQGVLSSCTANALLHAFKLRLIAQKYPVEELSRLFLYYEQRIRLNCVNEDGGSTIYSGVDVLKNSGVCLDRLHQYDCNRFRQRPSTQAYEDAKKRLVIDCAPVQQSLKEIKQQLLEGFPIVFGFMVYASFMSDDVKRTGNVPNPHLGERVLGGHAVMIYGFDDDKNGGSFMCRNSWGMDWGDHGNFYIRYDYVLNNRMAEDFWAIKNVSEPH